MKNNNFIIRFTYFVVALSYVAITLYFGLTNGATVDTFIKESLLSTDLYITTLILVITGFILLSSTKQFRILNNLCNSFKKASLEIENKSKGSKDIVWERIANGEKVFDDEMLQSQYSKYVDEMRRLSSKGTYKCDISEFINRDFIDSLTNKSVLATIPGVMTGLGILGTFVGLYIGLQGFKTGSASEITDSITPLMDGIKVAFSTSIIGMIFSLVFNYVYKKSYEMTYAENDKFIISHDKYVVNNPENENNSNILKLLFETQNSVSGISESLGESLVSILAPQFEKMNTVLEMLSTNISQHTADAIDESAQRFVESMNTSLGGNFKKLGEVLDQTSKLQEDNNNQIQSLMINLVNVNKVSDEIASKMALFNEKLDLYQSKCNEYIETVSKHMEQHKQAEGNLQSIIDNLVIQQQSANETANTLATELKNSVEDMEKFKSVVVKETHKSIEAISKFTETQVNNFEGLSKDTSDTLDKATSKLSSAASDLGEKLDRSISNMFKDLDKQLSIITGHLSGTIAQIRETTERVPLTVQAAYEGVEKSFDNMQKSFENLTQKIDDITNKNN